MFNISPILRITIGLLLLTISLLLIGDLLGLVPNQDQSRNDSRKAVSETLAVQISTQVADGRIDRADMILRALVEHNEQIQSIGLRSLTEGLVLKTEGHELAWTNSDEDKSTRTEIVVPILDSKGKWGNLEVKFKPYNEDWFDLTNRSFFTLIFFMAVLGFLFYWLFLKKVLSELDPSSAVPDRVRSALDVLAEGIVILDQTERIVLANRSFEKKIGLEEKELFGKHLANLDWMVADNSDSLKSTKLPWSELFESNEVPETRHMKLKTELKGVLTVDVNVAPIYGNNNTLRGAIVTVDDVTLLDKKNTELADTLKRLEISQEEILRQNVELAELATRDPLTKTLNRRSLFEGFAKLIPESADQQLPISCFIMDIDHFKSVNDNYGHAMGDQVIKAIANVMQEFLPVDGLLGRYGGEEFVVVLPGYDEMQAARLAEEMRLEIEDNEVSFDNQSLKVTSSFGVSCLKNENLTPDQMVDRADQALYKAKKSGRNRVVQFSNIESNEQTTIEIQRKPKTRLPEIQRTKLPLIELSDEGFSMELFDHEVIDAQGKLSIDTFDQMGNSSRVVVIDRLAQAVKVAKRANTRLAVLTIYIDTIQTINNLIGYGSAEKLRKVAYQRLNNIFRDSDSVLPEKSHHKKFSLSRSGDNEFTAVLNNLEDSDTVTWITQRMFAELKQEVDIDGSNIIMTANVGVSLYPNDGDTAEILMSNSSLALEEANKLDERESLLFFNHEMNQTSRNQLEIESQLYQAIERNEFVLYYQPIISIKTGRVEKWEALIRWQHPKIGLVAPDGFITIAENSGVIKKIGLWIVESATKQLRRWHDQGFNYLQMSINISAVQFNDPNLAEQIIKKVTELGVPSESIIFEITETALISRFDRASEEVHKLSEAGFHIALDDFGTGYSSLDLLRKLPINWVKVDRSFMNAFPQDINDVSIVSGLIGLSHNLGMRVIAEGVEEESQLVTLMDLGCDQFQGFFMSRPLTSDQSNYYLHNNESEILVNKIQRKRQSQSGSWDSLSQMSSIINHDRN